MTTEHDPCPRCGQLDYERKIKVELSGKRMTVCNLCAPEEISVPVEVRTGGHTVSTGMVKARLDWNRVQPVIGVESTMKAPPLWKRLLQNFAAFWKGLLKRSDGSV